MSVTVQHPRPFQFNEQDKAFVLAIIDAGPGAIVETPYGMDDGRAMSLVEWATKAVELAKKAAADTIARNQ